MAPTARHILAAVVALAASATGSMAQTGETEPMRSVNDGVYTADQAKAGESLYGRHCGECHASGFFRGDAFTFIWAGMPVSGFFDVVSTGMPMDNPASLEPEEYAAILAYILRINRYPAGDTPLPGTMEALDRIIIEEPPGHEDG